MKKFLLRNTLRNQMRMQMRMRRRALSDQEKKDAALKVMKHVMDNPLICNANHLAIFLSFDDEINTYPLIDALWKIGKQVYLPVLHPFTPGNLLFMHYTSATSLVLNQFNIFEPRLDINTLLPLSYIEVLFIPLVAFDIHGHRLGMGGGFYDRTLQNYRNQKNFQTIGIAYDCQKLTEPILSETWDIALSEIITPSCYWRWH